MEETPLEYDKQIWITFLTGIFASVIILYFFHKEIIPKNLEFISLILGFLVLVYSSFLIFGYSKKKEILMNLIYVSEAVKEMKCNLDKTYYVKTKWFGEIILVVLWFVYFYSFYSLEIWYVLVPVLILCCFTLMNVFYNLFSDKTI